MWSAVGDISLPENENPMNHEFLKSVFCLAGGWLYAAVAPAFPAGVVCTLMVLADVVTARRLARRLRKAAPQQAQRLKFCSARFGRVFATLVRIYAVLMLAAMVETTIVGREGLLRIVAGAVCLWQAVSMLENEASCNGARWARIMRNVLIDKTERHLGISLDELRRDVDDDAK